MLVNTHHHGDHTYGNSLFGGAVIIGHENCRTAMIATGLLGNTGIWDPVDWGDLTLAPPVLTFTDRIRLWPDDHPLDVSFAGQAAHTTNDALVWLPEHQVLFCGDLLFNGGTPFLLMGSVQGAVEVLQSVVAPIPARSARTPCRCASKSRRVRSKTRRLEAGAREVCNASETNDTVGR